MSAEFDEEVQVPQKPVYDFLYVDVNRIARLVAQMDGSGILKETVRELSRRTEANAEVKPPFFSFRLKGAEDAKRADRYDPSWRLPVQFLDEMAGRIATDPSGWAIGQIVSLTGSIAFRDFAFAGQLLKISRIHTRLTSPQLPSLMRLTNRQLTTFIEIADAMPHLLLALVTDGKANTWSTANVACTTASTGDLILKCGGDIQGLWTLTGILDTNLDSTSGPTWDCSTEGFGGEIRAFSEAVRVTLGRPPGAFGVTPLTIHRKVELPVPQD